MAAFSREKKSRKSAFAIDRFPVSLVSSPFKILSQKFDHCIKRQKYTEIGRINLYIKSKKGDYSGKFRNKNRQFKIAKKLEKLDK